MQGKGFIKFFFFLLLLVSLVQYLFIIPTNKVENEAESYAEQFTLGMEEGRVKNTAYNDARSAYLDSMSSETVFSIPLIKDYSYSELKAQQLALGLDLQGGMSTVLQVDLKDMIKRLSNNNKDQYFLAALDRAEERLRSEQTDFVTLFGEEFAKEPGGKKLSQIFRNNPAMRDEINTNTTDNEIIRKIRSQANETVDLTYKLLKERIDKFGVAQPNISKDESRDLILVELPGVSNPARARAYLQQTAELAFWDVYRFNDPGIIDAFFQADQRLTNLLSGDTSNIDEVKTRLDSLPVRDSLGNIIPDSFNINEVPIEDPTQGGPLLSVLSLNQISGTSTSYQLAVMGVAEKNKKDQITGMLEREEIKSLFPRDLVFMWSQKPITDFTTGEKTNLYTLFAIKKQRNSDNPPLEGDRVVDARENTDPMDNEIVVNLRMDSRGAKTWAEMTTKAAQDNNREVAIVLDGEVVSSPAVNEPITGGSTRISGNFTLQEAKDLANILQVGKLPARTKIIQESLIGPSLGKDNIAKSLRSLIIGLTLVLIFMVLYYGTGGIVSIISLLLNLFFIFGALASLGTVLTLPGIAGIVLTIGMAVDANVIIYERIREELRLGKTMTSSIRDGFKHSYSAIIDANVTTLLTAFVLAYFGLGPIKGFAVVLIIGVLSSLFTAVLMGRLIIDWWVGKGREISFFTPPTRNVLANLTTDWLSKRRIAYVISAIVIIAGLTSMFTRGFDLGVDFRGGYSYNIEFDEDMDINRAMLNEKLEATFATTTVVKSVDVLNTFNVTTDYLIDDTGDDAAERALSKLYEGVNELVGGNLDKDQFESPEGAGTHVTSSSKVGPTIADDIKDSSVKATIFALILIFIYIFIRFSHWQYSMGAVTALFHDTLVVLGMFSLLHGIVPWTMEIDQAFIAALLTVIGYSINDTVVVFDRIREYLNTYTGKSKKEVINDAINSTLSRTVITSLTTLFVVVILFIFGGTSIKGFAFALLLGIMVGTYSSIFIATPVMVDLSGELTTKKSSTTKRRFSKAAELK